jgi:hypothetical protein
MRVLHRPSRSQVVAWLMATLFTLVNAAAVLADGGSGGPYPR